jgi:hypothetical protein
LGVPGGPGKRIGWYALHLAATYFSVKVFTPWIAGRIHDWVLPSLAQGQMDSRFQFLLSHLFALSFIPAFCAGLMNYKYKSSAAGWVWIVPTFILLYQFWTFPTSMLQNHFAAAYHQYFSADFNLPEYQGYREMFATVSSDMLRGAEQLRFTAPFFAGIGYSISGLLSMRYAAMPRSA